MSRHYWIGVPLLALLIAANTTPAAAQQDDGWLAWQGCWRPDGDDSDTRLCIVPAGSGVRIVTLSGGQVQSESRLVADGQLHNIDQEGCKGTERAVWSADRQRVFVRSDLTCGTNITRKVTGIFALTSARSWISVQGVESGGTTGTRMVRYLESQPETLPLEIADVFRTNRLARETARYSATALLDLNDVKEALSQANARVVEDWLTAVGQPFNLDGRKLLELAADGVPSSTIDVLVAVSNPDHFAVSDRPGEDELRQTRRVRGVSCWDAGFGGSWYDPFGYRYGGYGYGCPSPGYSPWGWGYGGYYGWRYSPIVIVDRGKEGAGGKVGKSGYSSGRSSSGTAKRNDGSSGSGSAARPSGGTSGSGSSGKASDSSGSSDSGSTGEKAKKRD